MFQQDALLLVAHGSTRYPDAGRTAQTHAEALRGSFADVAVGLLNGIPSVADALAGLQAPVVHVVPFFMESGWFTNTAVPRALAAVTRREGQSLRYTAPIGTHAAMATLIEQRVRRMAPAASSVLVVGHGSARSPGRVTALHGHVASLGASGRFERVEAAFLEEPPFARTAMARMRGSSLAVVGFFAGVGGHVRDDLPELIAAETAQREVDQTLRDCGSIGDEPGMQRIIMHLVVAGA